MMTGATLSNGGTISPQKQPPPQQQQIRTILLNDQPVSPASSNRPYQMIHPDDLPQIERAKRFAAFACGQAEIRSGMNLGVGSGSTVKYLIDWMYEQRNAGKLHSIRCVPTSYQTGEWLRQAGLPMCTLDEVSELDITIDGADEVDHELTCIKGGGGCLLREKIVQSCAKRFVLIGNAEKYSDILGATYPSCAVEVVPFACAPVKRWIAEKVGGKCVLRMDQRKCFPSITENGNYILDWHFPKVLPGCDWNSLNQILLNIPGVVETGLFIGVAELAYFGTSDGEVLKVSPKKVPKLPFTQADYIKCEKWC